MILKKMVISVTLVCAFAMSSATMAYDKAHDRSSNVGGNRGNNTGEMNNDLEFRDSQIDSRTQTGNGFRLREIASGSPNPSDRVYMNYLYYNDMTRNHR